MKSANKPVQEMNTNAAPLQGNVPAFLSQDGDSIVHLLPHGKIVMHVNFYRVKFGAEKLPLKAEENIRKGRVYGFISQPAVYFSRNGEYLIHRVGDLRISKHVNFYKELLGLDYARKSSVEQPMKAQA